MVGCAGGGGAFMRRLGAAFLGVVTAASLLLLRPGPAHAADSVTCNGYVSEAVAKARTARQSACGYDLADPRWSADRNGHARWCRSASNDAVAAEAAHRRGQIKLC